MAVRVNKDAFNIREKLSELAVKFGLKGSELARAETVQEARDLVSAGRKNMVINGAMQIHQRGYSPTGVTNSYGVDRFVSAADGLDQYAVAYGQSNQSPDGFSKSLRVEGTTPETTMDSSEYLRIQHKIEAQSLQHLAFGSNSAKNITVSFWVRSSLPGDYAFHIWQQDTNQIVTSKYTIVSADTWQFVSFTYSGNTSGVIDNNNGIGLILNWILDAASNLTASSGLDAQWETYNSGSHFAAGHTANFCASNNNFYLTGVQLEVGKNATEFEHRSYGEELALCQRYFQITGSIGLANATTVGFSFRNYIQENVSLVVEMRDTPNPTLVSTINTFTPSGNGLTVTPKNVVLHYGPNGITLPSGEYWYGSLNLDSEF